MDQLSGKLSEKEKELLMAANGGMEDDDFDVVHLDMDED